MSGLRQPPGCALALSPSPSHRLSHCHRGPCVATLILPLLLPPLTALAAVTLTPPRTLSCSHWPCCCSQEASNLALAGPQVGPANQGLGLGAQGQQQAQYEAEARDHISTTAPTNSCGNHCTPVPTTTAPTVAPTTMAPTTAAPITAAPTAMSVSGDDKESELCDCPGESWQAECCV